MLKYYTPGLISLLFLPALCLLYLQKRGAFRKEGLLTVFKVDPDNYSKKSKYIKFWVPPEKIDFQCNITGERAMNEVRFIEAGAILRAIVQCRDTVHGLRFHFQQDATFEALVRALDICLLEKTHPFLTLENDVRVYYMPPPDTTNMIKTIPLCSVEDESPIKDKPNYWHTIFWDYWPLLLGYAGMVVFVLSTRIRRMRAVGFSRR
jgi:hypothetical protein